MSSGNRRAAIVTDLERSGALSVAELVERHGVSEMTIRRDLSELEGQGMLRRFHGGAMIDRRRSYEPPYLVREARNRQEKQRIGAAAAALVTDGDSLAIDYGTTTLEVARNLTAASNLSVITPNVRVALELADAPSVEVMLTGGRLRPGELSLIGREAERTFERHFVDIAILGTAGVDASHGITDFHLEEVAVKQAMAHCAKRVVVVADASKVGVVALGAVISVSDIDTLVTSVAVDNVQLAPFVDAGIDVHAV